jgi:6-phosphogluconolactonase
VSVFPIKSDHSLDKAVSNTSISANYWPLTLPGATNDVIKPTAIALASSGTYVYISAIDTTAGGGYVFGFTANADGTLSALNGGIPFSAGMYPSAVASDPSGAYLYVTDAANSSILGYQINAGLLTSLSGSPFKSGGSPSAIVIDAKGKFAYVANSQDSTVGAYSISNGNLTSVGAYTTGTQPVAIGIDPSLNEYLFTANFLGDNISGFQVNANDGSLLNSQFSPYRSNAQPTAVAAIPHGSAKK